MRAQEWYLYKDTEKEISTKAYWEITRRKFKFYPEICAIESSLQFISIMVWLLHTSYHYITITFTITFPNLLNDSQCFIDFWESNRKVLWQAVTSYICGNNQDVYKFPSKNLHLLCKIKLFLARISVLAPHLKQILNMNKLTLLVSVLKFWSL